jgi:putative DNA primase/helicase
LTVTTQPGSAPFTAPESIPDGQRNDVLFRLARSLKAKGVSHAAMAAAIREENTAKCPHPLPAEEIERIVAHAWGTADRPDFAAGSSHPVIEVGATGLQSALLDFGQLATLALPARQCHVPWLPEGGNIMVYGPRGVGKTFFQLGLAASLVTGASFLKWAIRDPVGVLYIDGEMPLDELRQRQTALLGQPPIRPLHFLSSEMVYHKLHQDLVLTRESVRDDILGMLDFHPDIRVVMLDNISCLFAGIDVDKKRDWEPIAAWLIRLRHRGLATILVHHAGKGGQQRGTSGREDALDTVIHLDRPATHEAKDSCHFEVTFTKCRSVRGEAVGPLDVTLGGPPGQLIWTYKDLERLKEEQVRLLLDEGMTRLPDIAETLGITRSYAWKLKRKIEKETAE